MTIFQNGFQIPFLTSLVASASPILIIAMILGEKVEENKVLAHPMDCPKKFKEYCKYHNVEIEDEGPEFYRLYLRMDAIKFLIPIPESCLKQSIHEKILF